MDMTAKIYVAGHAGMVGSAIVRQLQAQGYSNIIGHTRAQLDLTRQAAVEAFFAEIRPEYVFVAAAKVGGIGANSTHMADFLIQNLMIQTNILDCAHRYGVTKLMFLGSACIYPAVCPMPIREESLLSAPLEPTNEGYAIAKIAGIRACQYYQTQFGDRFIGVIPPNLYGINDNFNLEGSHVIPALIRRLHDAKIQRSPQLAIWGTGTPMREFLYVDDMADACIFLMKHYEENMPINIGTGFEITILDLARTIARVVGFEGDIITDPSRPDGMMRRVVDCGRIHAMGWRARTEFTEGLRQVYQWFLSQQGNIRQ